MTSEEFYQQMERSMGTKTPWITSGVIVPVDCIPVRLPPGKRGFFDK
jgi:hypothetical protein